MLLLGPPSPDTSIEKSQTKVLRLLLKWRLQVSTSHRKNKLTLDLDRNSYRIAHRTYEQGAHLANASQVAVEKSTTENNDNNNNIDITSSASTLNKHQKFIQRKETSYHLFTECTNTQKLSVARACSID